MLQNIHMNNIEKSGEQVRDDGGKLVLVLYIIENMYTYI